MAEGNLVLYDIHGKKVGSAELVEGEVIFNPPSTRWVWVLDARHEPYTELEFEEVLHRAEHVRKEYVLMAERSASDDANEADEGDDE